MVNNIPEILYSRKGINTALILLIALLGVLSFGLGRLSAQTNSKASILSCESATPIIYNTDTIISDDINEVSSGTIVASKNGSVYHFPWCSGAQRIKEENKVWFASKEEAEKAGYRPAANCKGLE